MILVDDRGRPALQSPSRECACMRRAISQSSMPARRARNAAYASAGAKRCALKHLRSCSAAYQQACQHDLWKTRRPTRCAAGATRSCNALHRGGRSESDQAVSVAAPCLSTALSTKTGDNRVVSPGRPAGRRRISRRCPKTPRDQRVSVLVRGFSTCSSTRTGDNRHHGRGVRCSRACSRCAASAVESMLVPDSSTPTRLPCSVSRSGPRRAAVVAAHAGSTATFRCANK